MTRPGNEPIEPQLIPVPAGSYPVGADQRQVELLAQRSPEGRKWLERGYFTREQPAHTVRLAAFRLAKGPVTVAEFGFNCGELERRRRQWEKAPADNELQTAKVAL